MARYNAKNLAETNKALQAIKKKNTQMVQGVRGSELGRAGIQAGFIVEARAKEILTEKGHIVTGNLRRSINTQLTRVGPFSATIEVGTFVVYGPFIENLPDGGYLFPASLETFPEVTRFLNERAIIPVLEKWGA